MENLNFDDLSQEIEKYLESANEVVLATCADNIVTARTMNHVNDGLTVMFGTVGSSVKAEQIRINQNVALVSGPLQIEAVAEFGGHPSKHALYTQKNEAKFPWMKSEFPPDPGDGGVLVICRPTKIKLYKFIEGKPHWDVLEVEEKKAYRI